MTANEALKVLKMFEDKEGKVDIKKVKEILEMVGDNSPFFYNYNKSIGVTPDPETTLEKRDIIRPSRTGDFIPIYYRSTSTTSEKPSESTTTLSSRDTEDIGSSSPF